MSLTLAATPNRIDPDRAPEGGIRPSMTFVTCIESGPLEEMVVRLAESLRTWGGRYRESRFLAIRPRFGSPLARRTRRDLDRLGVEYRRIRPVNPYPWLGYFNKPLAMIEAESIASTECLAFLDGDILVVGEPEGLGLGPDEEFAACASDKNIGSAGHGDRHEPYWEATCRTFGIGVDEMPWVTACQEGTPIRLYWNSGVFSYRRSTRFAAEFSRACTRILEGRVISHESGAFFTDQVALAMATLGAGVRWRALPYSHNYPLGAKIRHWHDPERLRRARILHYHDAMWPAFWPELLGMLGPVRPDVRDWLAGLGPLANRTARHWKALNRYLKASRSRRYEAYQAACLVV